MTGHFGLETPTGIYQLLLPICALLGSEAKFLMGNVDRTSQTVGQLRCSGGGSETKGITDQPIIECDPSIFLRVIPTVCTLDSCRAMQIG